MYQRNGWYYTKPRNHPAVALGTKNKKLATKLEAKIKTDIEEGRYFPSTKSKYMTMGELTGKYNDGRETEKLSPSSTNSDRAARNLILRFTSADTNVRDFTQNEVSDFLKWMRRHNYKDSVIAERFGYIKRVYRKAIDEWNILAENHNPTRGIKTPPSGEGRERYLTDEESQSLWKVLDRPEWHWMRDIVTVGLQVGFRNSNLAMMQWSWVDLNNRKITIPKEYVLKVQPNQTRKPFIMPMSDDVYSTLGVLYQAKNDNRGVMMVDNSDAGGAMSIGRIPISNNQRDLIDVKKNGSVFWGLKGKEDRYVFFIPTRYARTRTHTIWRMFCKDAKDRNQRSVISHANIEDFVVHDMKHDFCTKLVKNNVPITSVQKLAAHKNIKQTMRYAHVLEEAKEEGIQSFKPRKKLVSISSR